MMFILSTEENRELQDILYQSYTTIYLLAMLHSLFYGFGFINTIIIIYGVWITLTRFVSI